jgi:hypothetical protein
LSRADGDLARAHAFSISPSFSTVSGAFARRRRVVFAVSSNLSNHHFCVCSLLLVASPTATQFHKQCVRRVAEARRAEIGDRVPVFVLIEKFQLNIYLLASSLAALLLRCFRHKLKLRWLKCHTL